VNVFKIFLIWILGLLAFSAFGQNEARMIVNHGPGTIFDFDFSPDSKSIVTGGWDKRVKIWDCATGMETHTLITHNERVLSVRFSPDGKFVVSASFDSIINVWDASNYELITSFNTGASNVACEFDQMSTGLVVAHSNGEMSTWLVADWKVIDRWKAHEGYINDILIGPNNSLIFSAGADSKWKIWKISDPTVNSSTDMKAPVQNMTINSTGDKMALVYGNTSMEVIDYPNLNNGLGIAEIYAIAYLGFPFYTSPVFSPSGKELAYSNDKGDVVLVDLQTIKENKNEGNILNITCEHKDFIQKIAFSENGKYMATSSFDGSIRLTIFNKANLAAGSYKKNSDVKLSYKMLNTGLDRLHSIFYTDANTMCLTGANTYYFNLNTGDQLTYNPYIEGNVDFTELQTSLGLIRYHVESLGVWKGENIATWTVPPWTTDLDFKSMYITDSVNLLKVDLKANKVIFSRKLKSNVSYPVTNEKGNVLALVMLNNTIQLHDTESGALIRTIKGFDKKVNSIEFDKKGNSLIVTFYEDDSRIYDVSSGKLKSSIDHGEWGATSVDFSDDGKLLLVGTFHDHIELYETQTFSKIWDKDTELYVSDVAISPNSTQISFYGGADAVITYDLKTKKELLRHYPLAFKGLVSVTPDLFYMAPSFIEDELGFYAEDKVFPMEQFDLKYNRPDKVLENTGQGNSKLIKAYKKAHDKRLEKMQSKDASSGFHAPSIKINELDNLAGTVVKNKVEFTVTASDELVELSKVNVWINDVSIYGKNGLKVSGKSINQKISLDLASGFNKVQITVSNEEGIESLKETFNIVNSNIQETGNLYVIGIGTSTYSNEKFNLKYASKDASDFTKAMAQNKKYNKVFTKTLLNEEVTLENFKKLKSFLNKATRDDVVMVFVAGHGVLDQDFSYYYCPHNMDFKEPAKFGISYDELEGILDGITALKKLLFMDTCHSGEVDEEDVAISTEESDGEEGVTFRGVWKVESKSGFGLSNTSQLVKSMFLDLRKGTGATVISSSGGAEYAMESEEWKNGLFTYCLLNGFKDNLADLNNDGVLMLSEIQTYVSKMVTKLSKGKQTPTSRVVNNELDYKL